MSDQNNETTEQQGTEIQSSLYWTSEESPKDLTGIITTVQQPTLDDPDVMENRGMLETKDGKRYILPNHYSLRDKLMKVKDGSRVRVVFEGATGPKSTRYKKTTMVWRVFLL